MKHQKRRLIYDGHITEHGLVADYRDVLVAMFEACGRSCQHTSRALTSVLPLKVGLVAVSHALKKCGVKVHGGAKAGRVPSKSELQELLAKHSSTSRVVHRDVKPEKVTVPEKAAETSVPGFAFEGYLTTPWGVFHVALGSVPGTEVQQIQKSRTSIKAIRAMAQTASSDPKLEAVRANLEKFVTGSGTTNK